MKVLVKIPKIRNHVAKDLLTNGLYRQKVIKNKKNFSRKVKHKNNFTEGT